MINLLVTISFLLGWGQNLETALAKAKVENKLIVLNFSGSDWCGPCIQLKKQVFESQDFQDYANQKLELVRADFPRQKKNQLTKQQQTYNDGLAEKYNPKGKFPLTVLLSADGKVLKEWEGFPKGLDSKALIETINTHF